MKSKKTKNSSNHPKLMKDIKWQEFEKITIFKRTREKPTPIKWEK